MNKAKNPRMYGFFVVLLAIALFVPVLAAGGIPGDLDGDVSIQGDAQASRGTPMKICISYPVDVCYVIFYTKKSRVNQNIELWLMPLFFRSSCEIYRLKKNDSVLNTNIKSF